MHIEGFGVTDVVTAPDTVDDLAAGHDTSSIAQQQLQQLELPERQPHLLSVDHDLVAFNIDAYSVHLDDLRDQRGVVATPQDGADPGN